MANHRNCPSFKLQTLEDEQEKRRSSMPTIRHANQDPNCAKSSADKPLLAALQTARRHKYLEPSPRVLNVSSVSSVLVLGCCLLARLFMCVDGQSSQRSDPRPTIYSGQMSFGLLLSAHSSAGSELTSSASHQVKAIFALGDTKPTVGLNRSDSIARRSAITQAGNAQLEPSTLAPLATNVDERESLDLAASDFDDPSTRSLEPRQHNRRQIFQMHQPKMAPQNEGQCSQVNPNALYAGMGAIWASHQANLVGDTKVPIGAYVYDSCNDLDVGQRQSVRIVSNLNAFQQTTCESPRGSPISLTIAHGDNQMKAIQLLTSFRVPVISTKEHFALEDYSMLSTDQRRFLFATAPSSRHMALGALRFSKMIVAKSASSAKLHNQLYKTSSRNALIVISRNLPTRFIAYLREIIPAGGNYETIQSSQPIDQIRSIESLESILVKSRQTTPTSGSTTSETRRVSLVVQSVNTPKPTDPISGVESKLVARRSDESSPGIEYDLAGDQDNFKMLSPTILMFITPAEAIDLITRLRNDLADVSRYYSLIVATREDITPALKTIFQRGGSRLCSGKAFYTISPKSDDISEFNHYFRDTVKFEGDKSDHPLISEYANYQSSSRINSDLDDTSAEPVIKAVWAAAAAFKQVHKRECGSLLNSATSSMGSTEVPKGELASNAQAASDDPNSSSERIKTLKGRNSASANIKSAHSECMLKLSKNMSQLVQRTLKRLDVTINSTGLHSLDGFKIKFDESNELIGNKFSIKHIDKECDIEDIGEFAGLKDSALTIDERILEKSLESTLPDPWPLSALSSSTQPDPNSSTSSSNSPESANFNSLADFGPSKESSESAEATPGITDNGMSKSESPSTADLGPKQTTPGDETGPSGGDDESGNETSAIESSPDSRGLSRQQRASKKKWKSDATSSMDQDEQNNKIVKNLRVTTVPSVTTTLGARRMVPGVSDFAGLITDQPTTTRPNFSRPTYSTATQRLKSTDSRATTSTMRILKPFPSQAGTQVQDWLPSSEPTTLPPKPEVSTFMTTLKQSSGYSSTQTPFSTLPESGGNTDLDIPARSTIRKAKSSDRILDFAASTDTSDFVTASTNSKNTYKSEQTRVATSFPSTSPYSISMSPIGRQGFGSDPSRLDVLTTELPTQSLMNFSSDLNPTTLYPDHKQSTGGFNFLKDLNFSPVPLSPGRIKPISTVEMGGLQQEETFADNRTEPKVDRTRLRSHLRWIYNSWSALAILIANICGAILTLYVLTFLLMKNCDGSLDRENQGTRSMHLLAIIVVFFGSTLFIVAPTPGLCLLRTSWHNFGLVFLFGSLLSQSMQARALNTIGLGGKPSRLNQFLTLTFIVGVQVAFELQRWRYESANYLNFVSRYFGSPETDYKKLMVLGNAIASQFNPLDSFSDLVTPVSIQISEKYQTLLQDYCIQKTDDFLQGQIYLAMIVVLLILFTATSRNIDRLSTMNAHQNLMTMSSGKLVATEHEANLNLSPNQFHFASSSSSLDRDNGKILLVTLLDALIYAASLLLHIYGQNISNRDLILSLTMVLIAFVTLIGIFLPILNQLDRYESMSAATTTRPIIRGSKGSNHSNQPSTNAAFAMFPEFTPRGLPRPSSCSGDSSSGAGSGRPFAGTKESRRNMKFSLENLGPSTDSLRGMGFYEPDSSRDALEAKHVELGSQLRHHEGGQNSADGFDVHQTHAKKRPTKSADRRLIMLDVDPCCPKHGVAAWPKTNPDEPKVSRPRAR